MKLRSITLALLIVSSASAQWIVNDPVNTTVNLGIQSAQTVNHLEVLKNWADQLTKLNRQIRQLEDQLNEQRRIREVLGNPTLAGSKMVMDALAPEELARSYGETLRQIRRLADATRSMERTADGVYQKLENATLLNQPFTRQTTPYLRYASVESQADQTARVFDETVARQAVLQTDLATTLAKLPAASTQAEVDKLNVKVSALNGQLLLLVQERRDEIDQLRSQHIQNENQATKERLDWQEKQIAEERQTLDIVNPWQRAVQITPSSYTQP